MNIKIGIRQKLKLLGTFVFGDMADIVGWALGWFNDNVLQRINNPEEANLYCRDVIDFVAFLRSVLGRHGKWMTEAKRKATDDTIASVESVAAALEDLKVTREELRIIVEGARDAIKAWKAA